LEAQGDTQPLNNRAAAFTNVQGPPRVLLVASDPTRAAALENALQASNIRVDVRNPGQIPSDQTQLKEFAAIVLVDVLARDVPQAVEDALPVYVREQGGSLAMVGGRESFGAGGWRRSPVAEALPVNLDPQDRMQRPNLALALVIDRSGSMAEQAGVGVTKLDLAKQAVFESSTGLEQNDLIGIVAFDSAANWVQEMTKVPSIQELEASLSRIGDGGGTNIRAGIEPAAQALATADAKVKHVILLTDGLADSNYSDLIQQMRQDQVTITVVSIGQDANPALEQIAQLGGGRYYRVNNLGDVPRIFLAETVIVAGRDIVEEPVLPTVVLNAPVVRGLGGMQPLYGYNATEPRPAARTILATPDGKPLLAQWQYGLGRSIAWTSDFNGGGNGWARDWVAWGQFPRFASGLIDALLPPQQTEGLALQARTEGSNAILELTAENASGQPLDGATIQARLADPTDQNLPVTFTQVGPGRYRAVVPTTASGVYLAQAAVLDEQGQPLGSVSGGLVVAYSPEYAGSLLGVPPLLPDLARATGGREAPATESIFTPTEQPVGRVQEIALPLLWLALLLWPLDIALRRLMLRRRDLAPLAERFKTSPRPVQEPIADPTMVRLKAARQRVRTGRPETGDRRPEPAPQAVAVAPSASSVAAKPEPAPKPQPAAKPEPAPKPQPAAKAEPAPKAEQTPPKQPENPDDALASLLAAKQRNRQRGKRE
ncbi:MAG: FixH family protein, partial [Chloroflexaceae bacterium]|nr:FixH family protein [Chloroflexaceae bacterium]